MLRTETDRRKPPSFSPIPPALHEQMSNWAGAHIATVEAGHLSPITHPDDVTKVILAAIDATT